MGSNDQTKTDTVFTFVSLIIPHLLELCAISIIELSKQQTVNFFAPHSVSLRRDVSG